MKAEDKKEFVKVLVGLASIKRVDLTEEAYDLWWHSMRDWEVGDFKDAAGYLLKNCQFMPTPKDFEDIAKRQEMSAHEAWAVALQFSDGGWRVGKHQNSRIQKAVDALGGWHVVALCNFEKLGFLERRFISIYEDFDDGEKVRKALPNLTTKRIDGPVALDKIIKEAI